MEDVGATCFLLSSILLANNGFLQFPIQGTLLPLLSPCNCLFFHAFFTRLQSTSIFFYDHLRRLIINCIISGYFSFVWHQEDSFISLFGHVNFFIIYLVCVYVCTYASMYVWRSKDTFWESLLAFYCVNLGNWTPVTLLGGRCLCLLSPLPAHIVLVILDFSETKLPLLTLCLRKWLRQNKNSIWKLKVT